jgi:arylsulfatase A-like enzyme
MMEVCQTLLVRLLIALAGDGASTPIHATARLDDVDPVETLSPERFAGAPNVVVFVLDDVADVDLAGLPLPTLDRLAAHGVRFSAAFASPTCNRTRRSLIFGEWWIENSGSSCGGIIGTEPLLSQVSLAELYPLGASLVAGKWHVGADPVSGLIECGPQAHGFDSFEAGSGANVGNCNGTTYTDWERIDVCGSSVSTQS